MTDDDAQFVHELPGVQRVQEHGLPAVRVSSASASGVVFLQGAHVAAFQPAGAQPVLWMSENAIYAPGKALRGGIPICFPWFGPHPERKDFPAHGFARTRLFEYRGARVDPHGRTELELSLDSDEQTQRFFPHAFTARLRVAFGSTLGLQFFVTNRDEREFSFEEALHSYFSVADVAHTSLHGLAGARYVDKVREQAVFTEGPGELRFVAETDRVYESAATCTIADHAGKRSLVIEKEGSGATVVWNPWRERAAQMSDLGAAGWPRMLCVESANVGKSRITLAPGATHRLAVTLAIAGIS